MLLLRNHTAQKNTALQNHICLNITSCLPKHHHSWGHACPSFSPIGVSKSGPHGATPHHFGEGSLVLVDPRQSCGERQPGHGRSNPGRPSLMATTVFNATALANGTSNLIVRSAALNQSTDLVQAGVVFNDAVRASTGLFNLSGSGNQNPFLGAYLTDVHAVQNDIAAMLANAGHVTLGGQAFTLNTTDTAVLTSVQAQLGTLITAAAQTTNAATMTAAEETMHAVQADIRLEINNEPHIAGALNQVTFMANAGANDVASQNLPAGADDPAAVAAATAGSSLHAVGTVFNAAADAALG